MLIKKPLGYQILGGEEQLLLYDEVQEDEQSKSALAILDIDGYHFEIKDDYKTISPECTSITRHIRGSCTGTVNKPLQGIRFTFESQMEQTKHRQWRFCIPSIVYTEVQNPQTPVIRTFMEDRLSANFAAAYDVISKTLYSISKITPSGKTEAPLREKGDSSYLHKTENCSLGYMVNEQGAAGFRLCFPYEEISESVALDSRGTPVKAFYPLDGSDVDVTFTYFIEERQVDNYTDGVYHTFMNLEKTLENNPDQASANLPFTVEESIQLRTHSLKNSYREFDDGGAGFFFHFDPRKGYGSLPSGFGTSFNTIPHDSYVHILEYGFTGRQINSAWTVAAMEGGEWIEKGQRVIDFFLKHAMLDNGWLYSLYDLKTKSPFFSFGDEDAPKLHYISRTKDKGNYLRTMTEPMNDVLEAYQWYKKQGIDNRQWFDKVLCFADFLVDRQQKDGSWFRAYRPDGSMANIGADEGDSKSATAIPLIFLSNLCKELRATGKDDGIYLQTLEKAGNHILKQAVAREHYEGGTLDNPNIVDKEASQYAMAGLYHLYTLTKERKYIDGAKAAAKIFVTWNYIWNAPTQPGTYLDDKDFKTKGFGAINSIWGGGVVDIYSLFHIYELYQVGKETGEIFFMKMAKLMALGTRQILSCPTDDMSFTDLGMQPEGFGVCCQGSDEGMINKGDIWGTLGWIYSAGIYGLGRYIKASKQIKEEEQ